MPYEYHMVELAPGVLTGHGRGAGAAAAHLEKVVNSKAAEGWEFYRIDEFTVVENMGCGCLALVFGWLGRATSSAVDLYVVTFRRERGDQGNAPVG